MSVTRPQRDLHKQRKQTHSTGPPPDTCSIRGRTFGGPSRVLNNKRPDPATDNRRKEALMAAAKDPFA
ncbi:hypothetical protein EVAR_47271_1 [Eumeta japonica]|uniref:Uncharacterized protein n=1 Tax=Eumeta variegata TaxID=151549 RepID=A0A4C1XES4_EUMVA|nr:hypothetical protein EVAR_47271_1 [Eumeta japonica]